MIKVLIVDDEPFIRQGLRILIDWNELGFEIADEAANGKEAIQLLQEHQYDLIIADIKMPNINGIELIEFVYKNKLSDAKFIILSGFYEFDYAKKAIKYNVAEYILKPIQKDELVRVLMEFKENYFKREKAIAHKEQMERVVFDKHLISIIWNKYDENAILYVKKYLTDSKELRYINIELNLLDNYFITLTEQERYKEQKELYNILAEVLGENKHHVILGVNNQENCSDIGFIYAKAFSVKQNMGEKEYINSLLEPIKKKLKYRFNVYIGQQVDDIEQLSKSFKSAIIAKSFQTFEKNKEISYYEDIMDSKSGFASLNKDDIDKLIRSVEENNRKDMEIYINNIYQKLENNLVDPMYINLNINYLLYCLINLANELDPDANQEEVLQNICQGAFDQILVRGSSSHFKKFIFDFADYTDTLRKNTFRGVLCYIEKEIEEHYMENLSLKTLSEKYFINSAYLGQIFKKNYGVSFKDYLNNYRIDRATELLIRTDEKVYLIAERVGYNNLDYFINKFVAVKGKTPLQFRKQYLK